jgi:hypothetical protein
MWEYVVFETRNQELEDNSKQFADRIPHPLSREFYRLPSAFCFPQSEFFTAAIAQRSILNMLPFSQED